MNGKSNYFCPACGIGLKEDLSCGKCSFSVKEIKGNIPDFMGGPDGFKPFPDSFHEKYRFKLAQDAFSALLISYARQKMAGVRGDVLDIGCGTGYYSDSIFVNNSSVNLTGLDIGYSFDTSIISQTRNFVRADIFKAPFKNGSFDAIVSFDVIEHVEDDAGFAAAAVKLLKKGGVFLLGTPNIDRLTSKAEAFIKGPKKFPYDYGKDPILGETIHVREYSENSMSEVLQKLGDSITFNIEPIFTGIRLGKSALGIKYPGKITGKYATYLMANITKK